MLYLPIMFLTFLSPTFYSLSPTVRCMMYGFGDDQNPYTESVELLEDLVVEFITEMVRIVNFVNTSPIPPILHDWQIKISCKAKPWNVEYRRIIPWHHHPVMIFFHQDVRGCFKSERTKFRSSDKETGNSVAAVYQSIYTIEYCIAIPCINLYKSGLKWFETLNLKSPSQTLSTSNMHSQDLHRDSKVCTELLVTKT